MRYRTRGTWKVVGHLNALIAEGKYQATLKQVAEATGVGYQTVWGITQRLHEDERIEMHHYEDALRADNNAFPHAMIKLKACRWKIKKELAWLDEKFGRQK